MLFCMKLSSGKIKELAQRIDEQRLENGLSYAELARNVGVHPSQVQRICQAEFRTLGSNFMRICTALGIDPNDSTKICPVADPHWLELQRTVRTVWDGTPAGAAAITGLIRAAIAIRRPD